MGTAESSSPIVVATKRALRILPPLQVKVRYVGETGAVLTLPTYQAKNGELRIFYLGPGRGRGWRIKANGTFEHYLGAVRRAVRKINEEGRTS